MEQIQVIAEKEMTSKLMKEFSLRTFLYSFLYFGIIAILFILGLSLNKSGKVSLILSISLLTAINTLFLLILSKFSTTEAFDGINTTSAPRKSLDRILTAVAVPLFVITCIFTFFDVILLHSFFDISNGYNAMSMLAFGAMCALNIIVFSLIVNIYEKRILKKYLIIVEE